jgi:hypothetical protein
VIPSLGLHLDFVSSPYSSLAERFVPINEVWSRLSNCVLQRSCDCESCAYTQAEAKDTAVELPETVLESVPAAQALDARPARGHSCLVGEQSINDKGIESDDNRWAADNEDA